MLRERTPETPRVCLLGIQLRNVKNYLKGSEGTVVETHIGPEQRPFLPARLEQLIIYGALDRIIGRFFLGW